MFKYTDGRLFKDYHKTTFCFFTSCDLNYLLYGEENYLRIRSTGRCRLIGHYNLRIDKPFVD